MWGLHKTLPPETDAAEPADTSIEPTDVADTLLSPTDTHPSDTSAPQEDAISGDTAVSDDTGSMTGDTDGGD